MHTLRTRAGGRLRSSTRCKSGMRRNRVTGSLRPKILSRGGSRRFSTTTDCPSGPGRPAPLSRLSPDRKIAECGSSVSNGVRHPKWSLTPVVLTPVVLTS